MRKTLFFIVLLFLFCINTTVYAQNYFAYNSDKVRTTVDGAAANFFNLNCKKHEKTPIIQAIGGVFYTAQDDVNTSFYGLTYNFAYPISSIGAHKLYLAINPALSANSSNNLEVGRQFSYRLDLPIVSELHFGKPKSIGGLVGLGIVYNHITNKQSGFEPFTHNALGPIAEAGIRVPIAGKSYLVKASYQLNLYKKSIDNYQTDNVIGITLGMVF
jgi:hypothetical protein